MNIVIFTGDESRAKEIGAEIIDKLFLLGTCIITNNDKTFVFPKKNIVINIRLDWSSAVLDLKPKYFLLDKTCSHDFNAFVRRQLFITFNSVEAYSLRNLIMSAIEDVIYCNKED